MSDVKTVIQQLTLEQKCALLSGAATFKSRAMPQYGIPEIWLSDGPHGLRKQAGPADHLGQNPSEPATCFPTASAVASSWDPALGEEIGRALGAEAAAQDVAVVLGPGLNTKCSPLCGRNFEYFPKIPTFPARWPPRTSAASRQTAWPPAPNILPTTTRNCAAWLPIPSWMSAPCGNCT